MRTNARPYVFIGLMVSVVAAAGCYRQQMADQPRSIPLGASDFFQDGRASRSAPGGTVARGLLKEDSVLHTGKTGTNPVDRIPVPVTMELMARGRDRFTIYCTPCHDHTGSGQGMAVRRGFKRQPASFHVDRLREIQDGHFFDVITNGFGGMQDYSAQLKAEDRWAIVAYVRALQLARITKLENVPAAEQARSGEWR